MKLWREFRIFLAVLLACWLACPVARALVTLNDGHDRINASTSFSVSRDSNIFASSADAGDFVYAAGLSLTYQRRAGWIGVNAGVSMGASRFGKHTSQNFSNPSYSLELTKQSGRTTGSLSLSAARESRADAAVNFRNQSWNYNAGLNLRYPIRGRSTLTGGFAYSNRLYTSTTALASLATYSACFDYIHLLPRERDLILGYRYRASETSRHSSYADHSLSTGTSVRLIGGINGTLRAGFQTRLPSGAAKKEASSRSWSGSGSAARALTRKVNLRASMAKDFSTTATDSTVDNLSTTFDAQYAYSAKWSLSASSGWGASRFLGESGRVVLAQGSTPILGPNRHDDYANWGASLSYSRSKHLSLSLGYTWFESWSTVPIADFIRTAWNFSMSSSW